MRFKLSADTSTGPLKAWVLVPESLLPSGTIGHLESYLVDLFPSLCRANDNRGSVTNPRLSLSIDGFDLLADTSINVIAPDDVVRVTLASISQTAVIESGTKRKALSASSPESSPVASKRARKSNPPSTRTTTKERDLKKKARKDAKDAKKKVKQAKKERQMKEEAERRVRKEHERTIKKSVPVESSESEDSSSSESSSSSSSSSAPSVQSSKKPQPAPKSFLNVTPASENLPTRSSRPISSTIILTPIIPANPPVPPGAGSTATQERNIRRRRKKAALRAENAASARSAAVTVPKLPSLLPSPASPSPSVKSISSSSSSSSASSSSSSSSSSSCSSSSPSSPRAAASTLLPTQRALESVVPLSIAFNASSNRNKSSAYRKQAAGSVPTRISYNSVPPPSSLSASAASATPTRPEPFFAKPNTVTTPTNNNNHNKSFIRFDAPSDREVLPGNMWVSSVDVESDSWARVVGSGAWASYFGEPEPEPELEPEAETDITPKSRTRTDTEVFLDYGEDEEEGVERVLAPSTSTSTSTSTLPSASSIVSEHTVGWESEWAALEDAWRSLDGESHFKPSDLKQGSVIGWNDVTLNPKTYTPELTLLVALVRSVCTDSNSIRYILKPRPRPEQSYDAEESTDGVDEDEVLECPIAEIRALKGKILKF